MLTGPNLHVTLRYGGRRLGTMPQAMFALVVALALGRLGPSVSLWSSASAISAALAVIAGTGLLAWHFARLTVLPLADSRVAALAAAMVPLLLPGAGVGALLLPLILSLRAAWLRPEQRVVALMVQCGALVAVSGAAESGSAGSFAYATTLSLALILTLRNLSGAANDNPSMERAAPRTRMPATAVHARCESIPGSWGVSNV